MQHLFVPLIFNAFGHCSVNAAVVRHEISVAIFEASTGKATAEFSFVYTRIFVELFVLGGACHERIEARVAKQMMDV